MADFICFEADASDESNDEEAEMLIDDNLIDDSVQENNEPSFLGFIIKQEIIRKYWTV